MAIIKVEALECNKCGYIWISRSKELPVACSKCKSAYWNRGEPYNKKRKKDNKK